MNLKKLIFYAVMAVFVLGGILYYSVIFAPSLQPAGAGSGLAGTGAGSEPAVTSESIELVKGEIPLDAILLLDQSGSMRSTDRNGMRVEASRYFVANMAGKSSKEAPHRLGVIHFGSAATEKNKMALTVVTPEKGIDRVNSNIARLDLGDTNFLSALQMAFAEFQKSGSFSIRRRPIVVVFTDGEPDDSRKLSLTHYFDEIQKYMGENYGKFSFDIFVINLDSTGQLYAKTLPYWSKIVSSDHVYHIKDLGELREKFNDIVRKMLDIPDIPKVVLNRGVKEKTFDVPPYLEKMEFHIFPESPTLELGLIQPDGKKINTMSSGGNVKRFAAGTYSIVTIKDPMPGKWTYRIEKGSGSIEVYQNNIPIKISLINPSSYYYPQGKRLPVILSFKRSDGHAVKEDPSNPLKITAKVTSPSKKEWDLEFKPYLKDWLASDKIVEAKDAGTYEMKFAIKGGTKYEYTQIHRLSVMPLPYLEILEPGSDSPLALGDKLGLSIGLFLAGKPLDPRKYFSDHPNSLVLAQVKESPKGESKAFYLSLDEKNQNLFRNVLPFDHSKPGKYLLAVRMIGTPRESEKMKNEEITTLLFDSGESPEQVAARKKAILMKKIGYWVRFGIYLVILNYLLFLVLFIAVNLPGKSMSASMIIGADKEKKSVRLGGPFAFDRSNGHRYVIVNLEPGQKARLENFGVAVFNWILLFFPNGTVVKKGSMSDTHVGGLGIKIQ